MFESGTTCDYFTTRNYIYVYIDVDFKLKYELMGAFRMELQNTRLNDWTIKWAIKSNICVNESNSPTLTDHWLSESSVQFSFELHSSLVIE